MATKTLAFLLAVTLLSLTLLSTISASSDFGSDLSWIPSAGSGDGGLFVEDEFELDSEINRRILATARYISYAALNKNSVPCSRRGASYYNCRPGAAANPYRRGCSAITRCRS